MIYTHRIVSVTTTGLERTFEVRGDANATADAAVVPASAVIGRVTTYAPALGYLMALLSMPSGMISIMSGFASLLLLVAEDLERDQAPNPETVPAPVAERVLS